MDANYKATLVILKDIETHGLVQFNKEYYDEDFFLNFIELKKAFSHSMSELISKTGSFQTKKEEMDMFTAYSELSYISSHLEMLKKFLKIIINPIKIEEGFGEDTTLEQMIQRICKKMRYSEKLKNSIRGLFLAGFSNAVSRQRYLIQKTGEIVVYPKDEKMKQILNIKDLADNALQAMEVFDAMLDWSNGKTRIVDEKSAPLEEMVRDIAEQVETLDKKLDRLS